jgi:hypothetical protein
MTTRTSTPDLARELEAGPPPLPDEDRRLARTVARLLAQEEKPLDSARLAEALGRPEREVEVAIASLP